MSTEQAKAAAATTTTQEDNLLDKILDRTRPLNDKERERNKDYVGQFLVTFRDYPQRQKAASFNMDEVLAKLKEASK